MWIENLYYCQSSTYFTFQLVHFLFVVDYILVCLSPWLCCEQNSEELSKLSLLNYISCCFVEFMVHFVCISWFGADYYVRSGGLCKSELVLRGWLTERRIFTIIMACFYLV